MKPEALIYFEGRQQLAQVLSAPNAIGCVKLLIGDVELSRHASHLSDPNPEAAQLLNSAWRFVKKDPEIVAKEVEKCADAATLPVTLSEWTLEEVELLRAYWLIRLREAQASRARNKGTAISFYIKVAAAAKQHIKRIRVRTKGREAGFTEDEMKDPQVLLNVARDVLWEAHRELGEGGVKQKIKDVAQTIEAHLAHFQGARL